jgi:hypothetical protein
MSHHIDGNRDSQDENIILTGAFLVRTQEPAEALLPIPRINMSEQSSRAHQTVIFMGIVFVTKSYFLRLDKEDKYL